MNKHLQRIFLTALIVLMGGVNAAWADNVYTILYGTAVYDGETITGVTPQTDFTASDGTVASDFTSTDGNGNTAAMPVEGSVLASTASFSKMFETPATKGTVHFEANYTTTTNGSQTFKIVDSQGVVIFGTTNAGESNGNASKDWGFCNGESLGTGWFRQARKCHNRVVLDINMVTKVVSYTVLVSSGNGSYSTLTGTYNLPEGVADVAGLTATKQSYYAYMDYVSFYNVYDDAVAEYAYTLNYQLDGETIASETGAAEEGTVISAQSSLWNEGNTQKYYVTDGATTSFTIAAETNTFNVPVREAENWTYSLKAMVSGSELLTIKTGTVVEGETASYGYPQYLAKDGNLYKSVAQGSNPWWGKSFTPAANNESQEISYTQQAETGIVFCSEAEDIKTLSVVSGGNTDIRASNRQGAYAATADAVITSLAPGKYKIYAAAYGNAGTTFTFKAGEATVFTLTTSGNPVHTTSDEFTINAQTDVTVSGGNAGNSPKVIDYIFIQKTGDVETGGNNTVANYTVDFNTAIATSNHSFKVASNWKHIVDSYEDYWGTAAYPSYSYSETAGVDGTGALSCSTNQNSNSIYDLLVTPVVKGVVTIAAKATATYYTPQLTFYKITEDENGTLTRGEQITVDVSAVNATDFTTITIPVDEAGERIGIRSSYVWLDNFAAEEATIIPEKSIQIASADPTATTGTIKWNQQANGKVLVKYTVTVTNNGDVDLTQGTENYSVSIINRTTGDVIATAAVPQDLAVGATSEAFDVQGEVETSLWPNSYTYINMDLKENLQGSTLERTQSTYTAYESKFVFREAESTSTTSISSASWGTISESTTKQYEIANTGTAPMTITAITLPEGFTSDNAPEIPAEGLVVAAGEKVTLNITNDATASGPVNSTLTISYIPALAEAATDYTLTFTAVVIGANTWTADFNNSTSTVAYPAGSVAEAGINRDCQYVSSGNYNNWLIGYNTASYATENNKFITPKLHANAGDQLTFDVKAGYSSSNDYFVKVYVSADRTNWGEPVAYYTYTDDGEKASVGVGSTFTTKTISIAEAGDYYVAFALYGTSSGIDNIVGLEKVDVAHDLYIKSVSWPDASVKSGTSLSKPSVEFIPLTSEAADAYTVKYVCGETVLGEGTPETLTASANSSKTISFSWTPVVEETTTYADTKVVFEFTDGTTFETETFDLTVTNEAIFHFVNSIPSSKWYEPTDRTAPIVFAKTNTADKQTFYIYNWGSAPLTVNGITLPDAFTVSNDLQFPLTVAAFDENNLSAAAQAVEITFSTEEAGEFSGDMVISYGTDGEFTLPISGTKLDPNKWYANFGAESNQWPAGSVYQSNVSTTWVSTGNYAITSSNTTDNLFVTPKLNAAEGNKLLFDAQLYSTSWSEGKVVVYAAATRDEVLNAEEGTTRTQLFSVSGQDETNPMTTENQTFEVPALAGDNYYAFEISGRPYVDEIYGLTPVTVAHDWILASSNIPAEAMQNVESTATVNILNVGTQEETAYTATVYVDGEAVATENFTTAIPMSHKLSDAGTAVSVSYRLPKTGTFPVYVKVEAGDYSVQTEPVDVTFAEEEASGESSADVAGTQQNAPLNLYYNNSESVALYTSDVLASNYGMSDGAKIKSITFKAGRSSENTTTLNVWYEWTDDAELAQPANGIYTTDGLTQIIADKQQTWTNTGSTSTMGDQIVINFDEPIVYQAGKSLRMVVRSTASNTYAQTYFERSATTGLCYYHYQDTYSTFQTQSWTSTYLPVMHIVLDATPATFSGTVKNAEGEAIENAQITLVSNDGDNVQYSGTTDAEGAYSINVIQATRTYDVTVAAGSDYVPVTATVEFAGESVQKNFVVDVEPTAKYLKNPSFELADANGTASTAQALTNNGTYYGWQLPNLGTSFVNISIGDAANCNGNAFGVPSAKDGNYYYYARRGWNSSTTADATMSTTMTNMAEGHYTLKMAYKGLDSWDSSHSSKGSYFKLIAKAGDTELGAQQTATFDAVNGNSAGANKFAGDANWKEATLEFDVTTAGDVTLNIVHHLVGGVRTDVVIDNLQITDFKSLADAALEALNAEIATAEGLLDEAKTEGLADFQAAIAEAKSKKNSDDAAEINAAVEALKQAEEAYLTANLAIAEGAYYVYNPLTEKFLSRGNAYGTAAVVDDYGVAINVAVSDLTDGKYTLSSFDIGKNYGFDAWMYAGADGGNVRTYNINKVEGGVTVTNTNNSQLVYVYLKEDGNKYRVAGNAIKDDNYTDDAQTVWQFLTKAERDEMVAAREAAQKTAAFEAAEIAEDAEVTIADATEVSFTTGNAWTQTVVRTENDQPATNANGTEMWQATGNYKQTISNLPEGLYKVTIQAFYRNGVADDCVTRYNTGYNTVLAYLEANGNKAQVKSWASDKGEGNDPNSMAQAKAKFDEGKYLSEVYTYVTEDGQLNLTVNNPAFIGKGWFIVGNVKYAKVDKKSAKPGDITGDGDVTTGDAVAVVDFILEKSEPTEAQFEAADVNKDEVLTVSDAVGIVSIALGAWDGVLVNGARPATMFDYAGNYLVVDGADVALVNNASFTGFQMDVTLSEGAQFNGVQLTQRTSGHQVAWNRVGDRTYRIVVFSMGNDAISSAEGTLLHLDITGNQHVTVISNEFTDQQLQGYHLQLGDATGIHGIYTDDADTRIYNAAGQQRDKVRKGMNVIVDRNGKTVKVLRK